MKQLSRESFWMWSSVIGSCLQMAACGFPFFWGNLTVYTESYIWDRFRLESAMLTPWVLPLWLAGTAIGGLFAGAVFSYIGRSATLLVGSVAQGAGIAVASVAIDSDQSMVAFSVCLGLVQGIGSGISLTMTTHIVVDWAKDRAGVIVGVIRVFMLIGAIVTSQTVTSLLNPEDESPELVVNALTIFTQPHIVDKVPLMFLVVGLVYCGIAVLGVFMIREKSSLVNNKSNNSNNSNKDAEVTDYTAILSVGGRARYTVYTDIDPRHTKQGQQTRKQNQFIHKPTQQQQQQQKQQKCQLPNEERQEENTSHSTTEDTQHVTSDVVSDKPDDQSPLQLLKSGEFYILFTVLSLCCIDFVAINNYGKSFGQQFYHSDLFLTTLGNIVLAMTIVAFLLSGILLDKHTNKVCLIVYCSSLSVLSLLFYFSPMIHVGLFCITYVLFCSMASSTMVIFAVVIARAFGKTYLAINYAMLMFAFVPVNLVLPQLLDYTITDLGWFYIYLLSSVASFISLLLVVFTLKK